MIPNHPNFAAIDVGFKPYPEAPFVRPPWDLTQNPTSSISLGPNESPTTTGILTSRYWLLTYDGTSFCLEYSQFGAWVAKTAVFEPMSVPVYSDLSFDQFGRPIVTWTDIAGQMYLYSFNSQLGQFEERVLGAGKTPKLVTDYANSARDPRSDVVLFFVRDDNLYMAIQRESFNTLEFMGVRRPGLYIKTAGVNVDVRMQVDYEWDRGAALANPFPLILPLLNPSAELDTQYWDSVSGTLGIGRENPKPYFGAGHFKGAGGSCEAEQIVDLRDMVEDAADVALASNMALTWFQSSRAGNDRASVGFVFYDDTDTEISRSIPPPFAVSPALTWFRQSHSAPIPANTVKVGVLMVFDSVDGGDADGYIDSIRVIVS